MGAAPDGLNEVHLIGRVAATATTRELPSGDHICVLRVVVPRGGAGRPVGRAPTVDTVDCAIWAAGLRRRAERLDAGTVVEISGSLRRRFWRSPAGPASRYEVEVRSLRRVARTAGPAGPSG